MREWLKVVLGVAALVVIPTVPAFYVEYLWVMSRDHYPPEATTENESTKRDQRDAVPRPPPVNPRPAEENPAAGTYANQTSDRVSLTEVLLVIVGLLQFFAIAATVYVAARQTDLLRIQHRPLLRVRRFELTHSSNDDRMTVRFAIVNIGNSDAILKESRGGLDRVPPTVVPMPVYDGLTQVIDPRVFKSGARGEGFIIDRPDARQGPMLRVLGYLSYEDRLGNVRTTAFWHFNNATRRFEPIKDADCEYED